MYLVGVDPDPFSGFDGISREGECGRAVGHILEPPVFQGYGTGAQVGDLNISVGFVSRNQSVEKDALDHYTTCG